MDLKLEREALARYHSELPKARVLARRYEYWHHMYAPVGGDQWPEDRFERPGKIHITENIIRPFVDTDARLESILPRITNLPESNDEETQMRAEATEKVTLRWLENSGWETWMFTQAQVKRIYGKSVLKPFWNKESGSPDVYVIEQPQHLLIGWGDSDFTVADWAIFRGRISPLQAKLQYPGMPADAYKPHGQSEHLQAGAQDHEDPLDQQASRKSNPLRGTGYEADYVETWDYWYINDEGTVMNCTMLNGHLVGEPKPHPEYISIPYIVIEYDHEPGDPDGHGMVEMLIDIQMGLNRAMSHFAQYVWDNTDPAWQLVGENAPATVPDSIVPAAGEIVAPGPGTRIEPINSGVNQFPLADLIRAYIDGAHKVTGLPEVLFGGLPGAQTSARAVSVQIEAAINRLDPRRRRTYDALRQLFMFWYHMVKVMKPKVGDMQIADVIDGLTRWHILAPEITPRNEIEHITAVANKLGAKLISLQTAMDEVGVENPLEEMKRVMEERSNARLFPGDAQATAAVMATLQQIQANAGGGAVAAANEGEAAQGQMQRSAQEATPTNPDDMGPGVGPQPGGAPPPGAPSPIGGELQPLVRQTPSGESQAMSQIMLPRREI